MPEPAVIDASCEAKGHPSDCTEPAPGTVVSTSTHDITVTVGGTTKEIATIDTADMDFPSHAHEYSDEDGCHEKESHTIDPDEGDPSITINGSPIYEVDSAVTSDPGSGGDVDIVSNPIDTSMTTP